MRLWLLGLCLIAVFPLKGQYYNPVNYSIHDGLPSSEVYHVIQTDDGYVWFATDRGLCRYNGYEFESFTREDGLTDNTVFHFFPMDDGRIWCTTLNNKLFTFDIDLEFQSLPQIDSLSEAVKNAVPSDLFIHDGDLYISFKTLIGYIRISQQGQLYDHTSGNTLEALLVYETFETGGFAYSLEKGTDFKPIFENSDVVLHQTKNGNAINIEGDGSRVIIADNKDIFIYHDGIPIALELDKYPLAVGKLGDDFFWVGYRFGGFKIYSSNGELLFSDLPEKSVTSLFLDHERGLWVTTLNSGVYYYRYKQIHPSLVPGAASNSVTDITTDDSNQVYVGYANGDVLKWSRENHTVLFEAQRKSQAKVQYYDSLGEVLINSDHFHFVLSNPDSVFFERGILSYDDNPGHTPAMGSNNNFCIGLDKEDEISVPFRVNDLTPFQDGYCLASTYGLYYYDRVADTIGQLALTHPYRFEDVDLVNGTYYAGSMGDGLFIYDGSGIVSITQEDGLYSNMISEVTVENDSVIWVCTNRGLNRVELKADGSRHIKGVTREEGLLSNETIDVEIVGKSVWVGTKLGLCHFHKHLLEDHTDPSPNFFLSLQNVRVNDSDHDPNALNSLNYSENNIEFFFQAISYKHNPKLHYRYQLEGLDDNWYSTDRMSIRYPSIPPGAYRFQIQVYNSSLPNEFNELSLPIIISPPFYKTWWFFLLLLALLSGFIYLVFKLYIFTYNRDVVRELLRHLLKRIRIRDKYVVLRVGGKDVRVASSDITYIQAAGNYLDVHVNGRKYTVRCKISEFLSLVPDPIEFVQVHRSYIVRIDRITRKDSKAISIGDVEIPITKSFKDASQKIQF